MAADQLLLRSQTFLARKAWKKEYADGLRDNTLRLGRNRYTSGETVLAQADCERGALHARPDGCLWFARLDGTGVSDDETREGLFAPLRAIWHYDDRNGAPETDGRSVAGDLIIWDDGANDRFLGVCTGAGVYGLGVRADYRTAATATSGVTQNQPSDRIAMRSSRWDTSGTPAAKSREWSFQCGTSPSAGDSYSLLRIQRRHEGGPWTNVATLDTNGWLYLVGGVPGVEFNSGGSGAAFIHLTTSDPDGSLLKFRHASSTRWGRLRCYGTTAGDLGEAAEVLGVSYRTAAASGGDAIRRSPSFVHRAAAWNGAASVELAHYSQLVPTSDTAGYVEHGYSFGSGIHRFYGDGTFGSSGAILLGANAPAALRFGAAPGTHTALDAGTGGADAWIVVDKNGSDAYVPVLDTKDLGIPTVPEPVYGELSLTDGSASSSITDGPDAWNPVTGFDTVGEAAGCVPDTGVGAITPNAGALFEVSLCISFSGEAATEYVFAIAERVPPEGEGPPTFVQFSRQARVETIDTEKHSVSIVCLLDVTTGSALAPVAKSPTGATVGITILEGSFTIVKVAESTPS